ncbi:MAG TPA: hypothetical protein VL330_12265 [Actinomycetes bacterium]|nr:hypothetical protein [Actinomycetes bacterium]
MITLTTRVTASTEIGMRIIGRMIRRKICGSVAPSVRAASMISIGMPFRAADRITVANPTAPQIPTRISA